MATFIKRGLWFTLAIVQTILAVGVVRRMLATREGLTIRRSDTNVADRVSVIVPVLNEELRLNPCLAGLAAQGPELAEILVVDGGSSDRTKAVVEDWCNRDHRIRWIEAGAAAPGTNGKAHNLLAGMQVVASQSDWILTIDADVRPHPALVSSLLQFAKDHQLSALSVATRQRLSGWQEALVHPSMLTTLVYRFGIPGHATTNPAEVQANGQCMLIRRDALDSVRGFSSLDGTIAEDVAIARRLAASDIAVGFFESADLVDVEMYDSATAALVNWSRSLPMRDEYWGGAGRIGLATVALVQAAPLPLAFLAQQGGLVGFVGRLNLGLFMMRLGTLVGTRRAYQQAPITYWVSPATDIPVAAAVVLQAVRRSHTWRGRTVVRRDS